MASLISRNVQKADAAPRNANEARILAARAGHAALAQAFAPKPVRKSAAPAAPVSTSFVSGFGGASNMTEATRTKATKSDPLAALPVRARRAAERFTDGQKDFITLAYKRAKAAGEAVSFTKAEAGSVMGLSADDAGRAVDAMVAAGLLRPAFNSLGGVKGFLPGMTD